MVTHCMRSPGTAQQRRALLSARLAVWIACTAASASTLALALDAPDAGDAEPEPAAGAARADFDFATPAAPRGPRLTLEGSVERIDGQRPQLRQGGVSTIEVDVANRVWLGWGRASLGVGLGAQTQRLDQPVDRLLAQALQPVRPSMSVVWRYSLTETSSFYAGATAARAWGADDALPSYRARAGVEWKAARSRLGFDSGRLGLQLDSGYRMSIRTRSGGVQVALRRTF